MFEKVYHRCNRLIGMDNFKLIIDSPSNSSKAPNFWPDVPIKSRPAAAWGGPGGQYRRTSPEILMNERMTTCIVEEEDSG